MKSLKELYRVGKGPSSSHTMGPQKAAEIFLARHGDAARFDVHLYGSLAATGKGHLTDVAITDVLKDTAKVNIIWHPEISLPFHPNGMKYVAFDKQGNETDSWIVYSIGGGSLSEGKDQTDMFDTCDTYALNTMTEIMNW